MTELQRRVPGATIQTITDEPRGRRVTLAQLKVMQRRGEIGTVWIDEQTGQLSYQRLAEPRPRMPLYATVTAVALGAVVTAGVLVWHARYVLLAAALAALALWYLATRDCGCKCVIIHICGGH